MIHLCASFMLDQQAMGKEGQGHSQNGRAKLNYT